MAFHGRAKISPLVKNLEGHEVLSQHHGYQNAVLLRDELNSLAAFFLDKKGFVAVCQMWSVFPNHQLTGFRVDPPLPRPI